jgi:ABC-2 type transport system permease protein
VAFADFGLLVRGPDQLACLQPGKCSVGAAIAFVIAASILNGDHFLVAVQKVLPVHYWQDWTQMFAPGGTAHLGTGIVDQVATIVLATCVATVALLRRDPAA